MRRIHMASPALVGALAVMTSWTAPVLAQKAEVRRLCKPRLEWSSTGLSKAQAQRRTLDGWAAAAASQYGEAFTRWSLAGIARLSCTLTPEGHRCRAAGSPCRDLTDAADPKR